MPRELWRKAGDAGLLCPNVPAEYGGPGANFLYNVVITEELGRAGRDGPAVHGAFRHGRERTSWRSAREEQKTKWLPKMVSGEIIGAIGLTEPGGGSDLKAMRTRGAARRRRTT